MNQIFCLKLIKLLLFFGFLINITYASININSGRLLSQIINKSHPINPLNNSDRLSALCNISFVSIPGLKGYDYFPNIGFGFKVSKNLALEGSIFNKLSDSSFDQIISGGVQYFFGGKDTLSWVSSVKKSSYNSIKNYNVNSITFDISKWINLKSKFFRFGFGSSFYKKNNFSNNSVGQINFGFMNILIPIRVFQLGFGLEINQYSYLKSMFIQKDFH